jgi:hypothetical protein
MLAALRERNVQQVEPLLVRVAQPLEMLHRRWFGTIQFGVRFDETVLVSPRSQRGGEGGEADRGR